MSGVSAGYTPTIGQNKDNEWLQNYGIFTAEGVYQIMERLIMIPHHGVRLEIAGQLLVKINRIRYEN